jgi:hypothetical protein
MTDKSKHFIAGAIIAMIFRAWLGMGAGFLAALVAGAAKEGWDGWVGGDVSYPDLLATIAGGVVVEAAFTAVEGV